MNDSDLIFAAQAGDPEALNQLVLAYQDRIFNTARWLAGEDTLAADLTFEGPGSDPRSCRLAAQL